MPVINILSPHVADLIAAGEVVERPASVVKELLENAFDAGAGTVTVELRGGGLTYIRVTDDGSGMSPEDAGVCFLRHATSKLQSERDLEAIGTLGFRGEALAAISACSRLELITRRRGEGLGTRLTLEGGELRQMEAAGCPEGTTVIVRDLFYNTPARLKFVKSERAEASACVNLALRCALGRPEISVRCIRDGRDEFFSPGDGDPRSCVYSLLGRDLASKLLPCETESEGVRVHGFVSSPATGRGNRAAQHFFCNGRAIRSAALQAALEQAYRNTLLSGRFPACVLYVELSPGAVDVNVHPTKAEVKFSQEKKIFDGVYYGALAALEQERRVDTPAAPILAPRAIARMFSPPAREPGPAAARAPGPTEAAPGQSVTMRSSTAPYQTRLDLPQSDNACQGSYAVHRVSLFPDSAPQRPAAEAPRPVPAPKAQGPAVTAAPEEAPVRLVGEALDTYIIVEQGERLVLIDKHAAHERAIFDRLKGRETEIMSQALLVPITMPVDGEAMELIEESGPLLSQLGFELEPYGARDVILRALPADTDEGDAPALLEEILDKLRRGARVSRDQVRDELLHTVACKAAIKAGRRSEPQELLELARRVMAGEIKYCPHGRPVSIVMEKKELDKRFDRIV